jgi:hypothetical protein
VKVLVELVVPVQEKYHIMNMMETLIKLEPVILCVPTGHLVKLNRPGDVYSQKLGKG